MHPSCRHRKGDSTSVVADIGDQALTGHTRRSFDADVTHPCRAHQDTVSTRSGTYDACDPSRVLWHDAHRASASAAVQVATSHGEVEHASIRSPSLPFAFPSH